MRATVVKLTIFTLFTASITAGLASVIGNYQPLRGRYRIEAAFEDATGLLRGDLVTVAGVSVGKMSRARVEEGLAVVDLLLDEEVRVPKDSRAAVRYRNLIGQRVVAISPGEADDFLEEGDRIPVEQTDGPLDLGTVFNNLRPLVTAIDPADVNTVSKALAAALAPHKDDIDAILADGARLTGELSTREEKVASLLSNMSEVAASLAGEREQLESLLADFADLSALLAKRSDALDRTLVNLDRAAGDLGRLIADNRPSLDQDLADLATLLALVVRHQEDLARIARGLDDTVTATLRATSYGEWGNLYVFSLCQSAEPGCVPEAASTASFIRNRESGLDSFLYAAARGGA